MENCNIFVLIVSLICAVCPMYIITHFIVTEGGAKSITSKSVLYLSGQTQFCSGYIQN